MKQYYLPPVLESNARKGYLTPDLETTLAVIILHCVKLIKFRGIVFKKPVEKLDSFINIYYPIDIKCVDDKCMAIDPVVNEVIQDHGVIGSLAFMIQYPSSKPYIEPHIVINAPEPKYTINMYNEEYSIPASIKPGRYYIAYNTYLITNSGKYRVATEPPLYYIVEYPFMKDTIRAYNALRKYISRISINESNLLSKLGEYRLFLKNPLMRKQIEEGLRKLYDKKVISAGDSILALNIID